MQFIKVVILVLALVLMALAYDGYMPKVRKHVLSRALRDHAFYGTGWLKMKVDGVEYVPARKVYIVGVDLAAPEQREKMETANRKRYSRLATLRPDSGLWFNAKVSWYGPGFYGNHVAWSQGGVLLPSSMNFAHRTMKFGTVVEFQYHGRRVRATCTDRGPFVEGRSFDLGPGTARALGFSGVGFVQWRYTEGR